MKKEFIVAGSDIGKRLDKFLAAHCPALSRQKLHRYIIKGGVRVNGETKKPSFRLGSDNTVELLIGEEKNELKPYCCPIAVIYEDADILVLEKPQGLVVHPARPQQQQSLVNALIALNKPLYASHWLRPGIVHRLDKDTSGVMVVAKNRKSFENLQDQFKARTVDKEYHAICHGIIQKDSLCINLPLARDSRNRLKMKISFLKSKNAVTKLKVLERFAQSTYLCLHIMTGRMHQIRVHLKFLGHPIIGDAVYGIKDKYPQMFLHAYRLCFSHPRRRERIEFISKLPEHFQRYIEEQRCTG